MYYFHDLCVTIVFVWDVQIRFPLEEYYAIQAGDTWGISWSGGAAGKIAYDVFSNERQYCSGTTEIEVGDVASFFEPRNNRQYSVQAMYE